jgi:SAM-dependent methyltransferase
MNALRSLARWCATTSNTYRYATELPILRDAARAAGGQLGILLDAGAGSGFYSRTLLREGFCQRIIGVEPFAPNFHILENNFASLGDRARVINAPIENTGEPTGSVDTILCTQVLEHIPDDAAVVREFARLLCPRGHAIITVPQPPEPFEQPGHVREGYTQQTLGSLFSSCGFEAIRFDWALTHTTMRRFLFLRRFPIFVRLFIPPALWARESHRSIESRRDDQPYILLGLFRKLL